ncbi:MAG: M60 family metallopeptidase [Dysgonomonas sp.]
MKDIFKIHIIAILTFLPCLCLPSCKDNAAGGEDSDKPYLEISENKLTFIRFASSQAITINTNIKEITYRIAETADWISVTYSDNTLTVSVKDNPGAKSRTGSISIEGENIKKTLTISQETKNTNTDGILSDIKIPVKSGEASSFHTGDGIDKSFDGDMNTLYHSEWGNVNRFPITLTYNFENTVTIDYLVYSPRTDGGTNGNFKEFELWVATETKPLEKYGDYDFKGNSSASRISFSPALEKPTQIRFVVKSGIGDNNDIGFASCAEMEFYRKNPDNFDYMTIFSDVTCTQLKSEVTEAQINTITNQFFKELALDIYKGVYDAEFRVQDYRSWQHPDVMAKQNKTSTYGLRDNPTGIYTKTGEDIVVFVGDLKGQNISLFVQDPDDKISGYSYSLATGMNKISSAVSGLIYIMYYTDKGTEPAIKVHIAGGYVNGYFDNQKHNEDDWSKILGNATFRHFDIIGKYAILTFETEAIRTYTKTKGLDLINKYDKLVYDEQDFMGLVKYNKMYKNRAYFLVVYSGYMYAGGYHMGYEKGTQPEILDPAIFSTSAIWGPAHELGHVHQTRPGLRWLGMTEVTNNIHSQYIQTLWGNSSRLMTEDLGGGINRYQLAKTNIIDAKIAHNAEGDVFCKLVPFWQLKLYIHDALGNNDFYKDVYEAIRNSPNPATDGECQLQFVKIACEKADLDLTAFFEAWGFLKAVDIEIDDYSKGQFTITQKQIDDLKAEIAAKKYPKPKHENIQYITDNNVGNYK